MWLLPELSPGWEWVTHGDVILLTACFDGARAVFACRTGGVSKGEVAGLNFGLSSGDPGVNHNRRLLCAAVGVDEGSIAWARQVHGVAVADADRPGRVADAADVLVSSRAGITLMGMYADCVPIVVYDESLRLIALAHAGWRGTAAGVAGVAVAAVCERGGRVDSLGVVIGPAIGKCCYEVGADVVRELTGQPGRDGEMVDLKEINRQQLLTAGVREQAIMVSDICTSCRHDLFYSYRRSGGSPGRFAVLAWMEEDKG